MDFETRNLVYKKEGIANIADCVNKALESTKSVRILLENSAGQGSSLGRTFQELKDMLDLIKNKDRIGICLDTRHLFAAGIKSFCQIVLLMSLTRIRYPRKRRNRRVHKVHRSPVHQMYSC